MSSAAIINIIVASISIGVVFLYGCIGETLIEKVGNLNLGIPGIMCIGALGGGIGISLYFKLGFGDNINFFVVIFALVFSILFGALGGIIYAFFTVSLKQNQNVTGLVLTTFGVGLMKFFGKEFNLKNFSEASKAFKVLFVNYEKLGWFGEIFLSHGFLVYLIFIIAIILRYVLNKTKVGLFLRSIGESPQTADAQGINVNAYKYICIMIGSAIAGIGGTYYIFNRLGGQAFSEAVIDNFAWIAIALVIFSTWKPLIGILGSILFGFLYILPTNLNIPLSDIKLYSILPYLITIVVLVVTSILDAKNSQPPQSLGVNYFREDR